MPLPGSRDFDAVDSGPLPAATVNSIQDSIIGRAHGAIDQLIPLDAVRQSGMTLGAGQTFYEFVGVAATDLIRAVFPLRPGDRLLEWAAFGRDDAGPPIDRLRAQIFTRNPFAGWAGVQIGADQITDGLGGDQKWGEDLSVTPHVVLADRPISLVIDPDPAGGLGAGNTMRIYPVLYLRWDHP